MSGLETFEKLVKGSHALPFLFFGSGMSRRYLGLPDWKGLLSLFCKEISCDYEYLSSRHNQILPEIAFALSKEWHEMWFKGDVPSFYKEKMNSSDFKRVDSPLKYAISCFLNDITDSDFVFEKEEISLLRDVKVDGIITTNWDCFLEWLFPKFKVYRGQDEILFSHPQNVAEIYKIHGCASEPDSLVLTIEDYERFEKKEPIFDFKNNFNIR